MRGNPVNYDKKQFPIYPSNLDWDLKRYLDLIPGKEVLDLGIGHGKNSIPLVKLGYNVTGVDYSAKCIEICKTACPELNLIQSDIRTFLIKKNKYDLISSRCVLHFFHKDDSYEIINNIKSCLKLNGLVYIHVFSSDDPRLKLHANSKDFEVLENNILHNTVNDTYISFFTKNEILDLFKNFKTISITEDYSLDIVGGSPHYSGVIKYIGQKILY